MEEIESNDADSLRSKMRHDKVRIDKLRKEYESIMNEKTLTGMRRALAKLIELIDETEKYEKNQLDLATLELKIGITFGDKRLNKKRDGGSLPNDRSKATIVEEEEDPSYYRKRVVVDSLDEVRKKQAMTLVEKECAEVRERSIQNATNDRSRDRLFKKIH